MDLAYFEQQLADKHPDRMKVMSQSRALPLPDRFKLMCLAVRDDNPRIRYDAISQLGSLGTIDREQSREILEAALREDPEIDVKAAAADSLGALQIASSFPLLVQSYNDTQDWLLRLSIVAAVGSLGVRDAYDVLVEAVGSNNELVKISAIRALGDLGDDRAVNLLAQFVDHPDWQIRHALAQSLGNLGEQGKPILRQLTQDQSPQVVESAQNALLVANS